jgi:hypothetical protein
MPEPMDEQATMVGGRTAMEPMTPPRTLQPPPSAPPAGPTVFPAAPQLRMERAPPPFAWLVVVDAPDRGEIGRTKALQPGRTAIGRSSRKGNHFVLRDESCSSLHAEVRVEEGGGAGPAFVIYDSGSKNGVSVGDRQSYREEANRIQRHELQDGDYILLGQTTLVFKRI